MRGMSLEFVACKGGSMVDPRLPWDMYEEALSLRLMYCSGELPSGKAMTTASSLLAEGNEAFSKSPCFSSGVGWKSSL
jgi:hypothetical protein